MLLLILSDGLHKQSCRLRMKKVYFFLPNQYTFYFSYCLIALTKTSGKVMKGMAAADILSEQSGKASRFSPLDTMLAVGFL